MNSIIIGYEDKLNEDTYLLFSHYVKELLDNIYNEPELDDLYLDNTLDELKDIEDNIDSFVKNLRDIIKDSNKILSNYNQSHSGIVYKLTNIQNIGKANPILSIIIYILSKNIKDDDIKLLFKLYDEISNSGLVKEPNPKDSVLKYHPHILNDIFIRDVKFNKKLVNKIESDFPQYYLKIC